MSTFFMPTKIIKGENAVTSNPDSLILGSRAFIVTGKSSGKLSGALSDVKKVLEDRKIPYCVYDKIENNPEISSMATASCVCREFGADFIIAIGGGSPLDAAKAIAVYTVNEPREGTDFTLYSIFDGKYKNKPLPMCAIPTTAGTGSEVTPYSILTLHKEQTKRSFSSPEVFFKNAFLDGKYTQGLPKQVARNTAVDAMCHLIEGYTNKRATDMTDYMALEGLRILGKHLHSLYTGNFTRDICTELLFASSIGGIVISQTGTTIVHSMGYQLTYFKDIPHGMANGHLIYEYLLRVNDVLPDKVTFVLSALGLENLTDFKNYITKITPRTVIFTTSELEAFVKTSIKARNAASCPFPISEEIELEIYKSSLL
ncbi:MAG: iron-containing alcohol dehydrogenase [Clostridia bacterium]|nr:iron-containing alcohol dehydrogenase [Clostridia bacterium]